MKNSLHNKNKTAFRLHAYSKVPPELHTLPPLHLPLPLLSTLCPPLHPPHPYRLPTHTPAYP